jgi:hypothetical protein
LGAEIEHARIPQRVGEMLEEVGVDANTARRVTKAGFGLRFFLIAAIYNISKSHDGYARGLLLSVSDGLLISPAPPHT